ncbi:Fic family protein [uncultured Fluviicola sp.]|uniref:Fic family protein n=1 Tax=uncultured Fluviicola sp. TaxID=463303 RepID=UPI0025EEC4DD|nr:Fic family protein [uncultured Fluviicola sp.]
MSLGSVFKEARLQFNYTLKELSNLSGIDTALLNKYEKGERQPSEKHLQLLILHLDLDEDDTKATWIGERIYALFDDDSRLFEKAMQVAEKRVRYNRKNKTKHEKSISSELSELLQECSHLLSTWSSKRPLNQLQLKKMEEYFNLNYTYESNRIEGNTLTLQETYLVVNDGITVGGKSVREHLEAINHAEAISYLGEIIQNKTVFSERVLKEIHYLILKGIDRENAGVYRAIGVRISGSSHLPPEPYLLNPLMEEVFVYYKENKSILHPVILAAEMHERIVRIHPFIDGNGRTCRLIMNLILMQHGYPIANIKGELENRLRYYNALETASEDNKNAFHTLIAETVIHALKEHIALCG